ncbi:MAG: NAD(P)H-quinone oxidoreductase [Gammaproteobacteria bacterium]
MKAVLLNGFGDADVLKVGEADDPAAREGQVRIKVMATSVNRPDIIQREGNYPPPKGESEILGLEVAGVVDQVGAGVTGVEPGQRVMTLVGGGGYAEFAVAHAGHLIPIPDEMSFEEAACVCETYITAYLNLFLIGGLRNGDTALVHGGGGGVNTAAIQLIKTLTPDVRLAVTASTGKVDRVKELGADLVIDYRNQDFAEEIRTYTGKRGADVILDHIGAAYLAANMKSLAVGGRLVVIGVLGGAKGELNLALMMVKRQQIIGSVLRSRPVQEKADIVARFTEAVLPLLAERRIVPLIHKIYRLEEAAEAHRAMEAGTHFGKIVLAMGDSR